MDALQYNCPHCGSPIDPSKINFKTRHAHCEWCDQEVIFPKKHSSNSANVETALQSAITMFNSGNQFEGANSLAIKISEMTNHCAPAEFIKAFYSYYHGSIKNSEAMDKFFNVILPDCELEVEEEDALKALLLKASKVSINYEKQILAKFLEYDDDKELVDFVESFSVLSITNKQTIDWFDADMVDIYKNITKKVNTPKLWYALYASISKNPDSPIPGNNFFLKTKTQRFYNNFVLPIGEIFSFIKDPTLKVKFLGGYNKIKATFESKMNN